MLPSSCLDWSVTPVGPGQNPQYTGAVKDGRLWVARQTTQPMSPITTIARVTPTSTDEKHDDPMNDLDVNMAMWGFLPNVTLRAAVRLGQDYEANLRYVTKIFWNSVGQLFRERQNLRLLRLCALRGKMGDDPISTWTIKIGWCSENNHFKDMNRVDGMPEFEWKYFQESQRWASSRRFKN